MPVLAALALIVASLLAATGPATAQDKPAPGATVIATIGDSLADGLWGGLYKLVQKDKRYWIHRGAKHSLGFTGADLTELIDKPFAAGDVHALVMMIGANDRRSFFVDGKSKALLGTPKWIELYQGRIEKFMDHAGKRNVPLIWMLLPIMRDDTATRDARLVNGIIVAAAKGRAHVSVIETEPLTVDDKGKYTAHFNDLTGHRRQMRAGDGVHFEQAAYELLGDHILKRLREVSPRFKELAAAQ